MKVNQKSKAKIRNEKQNLRLLEISRTKYLRQNKESLPDKKELLTSLRKNSERIKKS